MTENRAPYETPNQEPQPQPTQDLLPCGHPIAAANQEPGTRTRFCRWCADLDMARREERERCAGIALAREMDYIKNGSNDCHTYAGIVCGQIVAAIREAAND